MDLFSRKKKVNPDGKESSGAITQNTKTKTNKMKNNNYFAL